MFTQRISPARICTLALVLVIACLASPASRVHAANVFTVTNTADSGAGSLRQALLDAISADAGPALIAFNIPKSDPGYGLNTAGVWTIRPLTALPTLTVGAITMDGNTQKANQGNTNPKGPNVEIDGVNLCCAPAIFSIESGANTIQGLTINDEWNDGVQIVGSPSFSPSGNYIQYNYIGTDATGSVARANNTGIEILGGASYNFIIGNSIAGNSLDGIEIAGNGTDNNRIYDNDIGFKKGWVEAPLPNGRHGIFITGGPSGTLVGAAGHVNYIGGNGMNGIFIVGAHDNAVSFNTTNVPNGRHGIALEAGAYNNDIHDNGFSRNQGHGIYMAGSGTSYNSVRQNFFYVNGLHGVAIYAGADSNYLGGNYVGTNGWSGVAIVKSNNNTVINNTIGIDEAANLAGNGFYGVAVVGGSNNTIGPGNVIAHNGLTTASDGVRIDGATALHNRIARNSIFANGGKGIRNINGGNTQLLVPAIYQANCSAVHGMAGSGFTVEIFSDSSDEGRYYEGSTVANWITPAFSWSGAFRGPKVTVTATDSDGNTSEFSAPISGACLKLLLPLIRR